MPTYQYACTNPDCGERFELVQSFTEPTASDCPVCGGAVRKVFSAVGVVFKGSGFYRTDSRAAANGKSKSDAAAASKSSSSSESSSSPSESKSSSSAESSGSTSTSPAPASTGSGSGGSTGKAAASA